MSYSYETEKQNLMNAGGIETVLTVYRNAQSFFKTAGACTVGKAINGCAGSSFTMLAAVDFLVEHGHVRYASKDGWTQNWVLVPPGQD